MASKPVISERSEEFLLVKSQQKEKFLVAAVIFRSLPLRGSNVARGPAFTGWPFPSYRVCTLADRHQLD